MRNLVLGASVLGCNLAMNLFHSRKDVTLLAWGDWGRQIEENGLTVKYRYSLKKSTAKIPVVHTLDAQDVYDVIFVTVRFTQLDSVIHLLRENLSCNVVFVGNNTRAEQSAAALPEKNVMFAFASSAECVILPDDEDFRSEKYYKICYKLYELMCMTSLGKICTSNYAMSAVEEMSALNEDLKSIFIQAGATFEDWLRLEADAAKYLKTDMGDTK